MEARQWGPTGTWILVVCARVRIRRLCCVVRCLRVAQVLFSESACPFSVRLLPQMSERSPWRRPLI